MDEDDRADEPPARLEREWRGLSAVTRHSIFFLRGGGETSKEMKLGLGPFSHFFGVEGVAAAANKY